MKNLTEDLSTAILRFRDLVTERGGTIRRHKEISEQGGEGESYVWWGWWNKRDETVPDAAFRQLLKKAQGGGLVIYLFDSYQEKLYEATCLDITWQLSLAEFSTPEPGKTPEYYVGQQYLAWFKLRGIKEAEDAAAVLQRFTYVRVPEFFIEGKSAFEPFYGKQVSSLAELRRQDRTIWFVRQFREKDPTHEVSLLDPRAAMPVHFSQDFFESPSRTLLWVSDPHFSEGHHGFPLRPDTARSSFDLGHRIESEFKARYGGVAGLIVSGDITWQALPEEYEMAKEFIKRINVWSPLQSAQIAVCPGNHDLSFSSDPADKNSPIKTVGHGSRSAYSDFYRDLFYLGPNEYLSCGRRFLLGRAVPVEVVCLNSSWLQQLKGAFQGHGFIGQEQREDAARQMGWQAESDAPRAFRIVVLHHHLLPTTYSATPEANYPYSVVLDAEALARWLVDHRVDLVLHGHMHQPFVARVSRPVDRKAPEKEWFEFAIVGLGSSGVKGELGEDAVNTVGFLTFEREHLRVSVHSVHHTNPSALLWSLRVPLHRAAAT